MTEEKPEETYEEDDMIEHAVVPLHAGVYKWDHVTDQSAEGVHDNTTVLVMRLFQPHLHPVGYHSGDN